MKKPKKKYHFSAPNPEELESSRMHDPQAEAFAKKPLKYTRPKRTLLKTLLHPLENMGIAPYHKHLRDGLKLLEEGYYKDGYNAFLMANHRNPKKVEPYLGMAHCLEELGGTENLKEAVEHLRRAIAIKPLDTQVYEELIALLYSEGHLEEAQKYKKKQFTAKTLRANPGNALANNNMGVMYMGMHDFERAIEFFKKALKANRNLRIAQLNLAKVYFYRSQEVHDAAERQNCLDLCRREIDRIKGNMDIAETLVLRAKIALHEKKLQEAKNLLVRAKNIDGTMREIFATMQLVEEKLGNVAGATTAFETYKSLKRV